MGGGGRAGPCKAGGGACRAGPRVALGRGRGLLVGGARAASPGPGAGGAGGRGGLVPSSAFGQGDGRHFPGGGGTWRRRGQGPIPRRAGRGRGAPPLASEAGPAVPFVARCGWGRAEGRGKGRAREGEPERGRRRRTMEPMCACGSGTAPPPLLPPPGGDAAPPLPLAPAPAPRG